jgi:hypothetical protein
MKLREETAGWKVRAAVVWSPIKECVKRVDCYRVNGQIMRSPINDLRQVRKITDPPICFGSNPVKRHCDTRNLLACF